MPPQAEAELQEQYFQPLVKKEEMEEKMRSIKEVKCRVVTCKTVSGARATAGEWNTDGTKRLLDHPVDSHLSLSWP